jgi:hypothetical protein
MQEYQVSVIMSLCECFHNSPSKHISHYPFFTGNNTSPANWDEKQFTGACLIAHLYRGSDFNGSLYYDANSRFPRDDVEVFAAGFRNGYDVSGVVN